jgi:hypothetical protein
LSATANCEGTTASAKFALGSPDGVVDLKLANARTLPATRTIDVAFILDTTGSMGEEIAAVKTTIQKVASSLGQGNVKVRIGMVAFKDRGDEYVTKVYPMTTDLDGFTRDVASIRASGGGDTPESVNEGVHVALSKLDWSQDAVGKYAFLVGDAPPHRRAEQGREREALQRAAPRERLRQLRAARRWSRRWRATRSRPAKAR